MAEMEYDTLFKVDAYYINMFCLMRVNGELQLN